MSADRVRRATRAAGGSVMNTIVTTHRWCGDDQEHDPHDIGPGCSTLLPRSLRCPGVVKVSDLVRELAHALWLIECNYQREGSGPGSRFEGKTLQVVQAEFAVRRVVQS